MAGRKKKRIEGSKNALWTLYQNADQLVRDEIQLELKKADLFDHWLRTASVAGYNLYHAAAPLRDTFVRLLPESAPLFEKNANLQTAEA
ncbi:hypothetical protein [Arsenicibacter rosenii]|uniref:Uncharacterized protein n=1 Tax=Arsenicibacter rosenii TaxID=1750698 RepID=A0A1S2VLX5_9BACT|nr:hypothetical protein [Arsenicibacter rosenii]OIN59771.1 hypothetical protein BLX24_07905 [Arsenicibacter rosenii]